MRSLILLCTILASTKAYTPQSQSSPSLANRRAFIKNASLLTLTGAAATTLTLNPQQAEAIGPVKITLKVKNYSAKICPPDRPIPGEKAMKGMKGLCVTVQADLLDASPKDLEKVGVYGFVIDGISGDSVLANNPDLSTDAGQFAMIESITPRTTSVEFEFIAAVPMDKDLSLYDNGIGELDFQSMRIISFPGGQQYGAVSPCEMNEFSDECETWEVENGPFKKGDFMIKSNARTKGR